MNRLSIANGIVCWVKPLLGIRFSSTSLTNLNNTWKEKEKLAKPTIQRHETPPPKVYYAPDWQLDKTDRDKVYDPLRGYGTTPEKWEYYNKVVWPKGYRVPETGLPKSREVFHCRESIHFYPKRMWNACQFARRMNTKEALIQLKFKQNKASLILAEIIQEAMERAKKEFHIENPDKMFVAESFLIQNNIIKGRRRMARDNWKPIRYRLEEGDPPAYKGRAPEIDGWQQMRDYYQYLRSRNVKYSL